MYIEIYVLDGGVWDGQYAFHSWSRADEHKVGITVPDGAELVRWQGTRVLRLSNGRDLNAAQALNYCRMGVAGFNTHDSELISHLGSGRDSGVSNSGVRGGVTH